MKKLIFLILPVVLFLYTPQVEGQAVRNAKKRIVENTIVTQRGQARRTVRRFRRRRHRRVYRRTLRNLPANTNYVVFSKNKYYPVNGYFYVKSKGSFVAVAPPVGFRIARVPWTLTRLTVANRAYHYANGLYYVEQNGAFELVDPPLGAKVKELPEEAEQKSIDGQTYHIFDQSVYLSDDELYELVGYLED